MVIDYPFDEEGHGPQDDCAKLETVRRRGEPARTFVWLPRFFTRQTLSDLGTLVVLDYLLTGSVLVITRRTCRRWIGPRRGRCSRIRRASSNNG